MYNKIMGAKVSTILNIGMSGINIEVECQITNGLPSMNIVGSASTVVNESRERVRNALLSSDLPYPRRRISINLAPGDVPKSGASLDLAIAMSIIAADGHIKTKELANYVFIGELGLDGSLRPVRGLIGRLIYLLSQQESEKIVIVPAANLKQLENMSGLKFIGADNLAQVYGHFTNSKLEIIPKKPKLGLKNKMVSPVNSKELLLNQVIGQQSAKRALLIAAAGGHNCLLYGPPGVGKSMLAKSFAQLLPPMSSQEQLEVTHLHSLVQHSVEEVINSRPFRSPHHTSSHISLTGGGNNITPGEISLSHHGVLFLDELPEFNRNSLESLRQPLEDRLVTITRASGAVTYPANFILLATANPCPCGYLGDAEKCSCTLAQISNYQKRLSGPLLDRIDLFVKAEPIIHSNLLIQNSEQQKLDLKPITLARKVQCKRYKSDLILNSQVNSNELKDIAKLKPEARNLLETAGEKLSMSARAYIRTLRVAKTIADMEDSNFIDASHIAEALQYRHNQQAFSHLSA